MWNQVAVILLGLWVTVSPDVLQYDGPERLNNHIIGPLVMTTASVALAESTRPVRWLNVGFGAWLIVAPALLGFAPLHIGVRSSLIGAAVLGLSLWEGPRTERLGGGWRRLWKKPDSSDASHHDARVGEPSSLRHAERKRRS